ncbi:MAG: dihydrodipicolinate reductase C-terminal domain-containing protein [Candidatus Acidiferrum sp.]|jgi:4-hydroxy-tetrahydrodipicolinate reductase
MNTPLAIVGYGKMGHLVEQLAPQYGFAVRATLSSANIRELSVESLNGAAIAVEFTTPSAAPSNLQTLAALGVSTVCGTTGWLAELPAVRAAIAAANTGLVYSANFSIGVNLFLQAVATAAASFAKHPEYEAWGWEIHHSAKKDAPSGTLNALAQEIRSSGYTRTLTLSSNRAGANPGTHEIGFDSAADTITLRHTARSREGFARGALRAAQWLAGKKGVHEFRNILGELN